MVSGVPARCALALALALASAAHGVDSGDPQSLVDLSIEELGQIEVTSVSRRQESLSDAPAAVYVITREEILRSGVTSITEALRLAPGVEVARGGAHSWSITMRGFNSDLSNKLLVLIDGRSVYSPLFAGVFWDVQDTLLEDIERIEVIAGPGGTLWGANAVNGVINIITRSAWDTRGGIAQIGAGDEHDALVGVRYGRRLGSNLAGRAYVKHHARDASVSLEGPSARDDWQLSQGGFRLDWDLGRDLVTLQGDVYEGELDDLVRGDFVLGTLPEVDLPDTVDVAGHNLLGSWQRNLEDGAQLRLQAYFDHTERSIPGSFTEHRDTGDVELVHNLSFRGRHDLIWGAGFRVTEDDIDNSTFAAFTPDARTDLTYSLFLQDRIDLHDGRLFLTLGSKLEQNDYSGTEHQPNLRLSWLATPRQTLWGAVSRAVRIPARLNEDLELHAPVPGLPVPFYVNVRGTSDFEPEELIAYEVGYRIVRGEVSADVAVFYNDYDRLMTNEVLGPPELVPGPMPYLVLPVIQGNGLRGQTYGGTVDLKWQPHRAWRLELQLSHLDFDLDLRPGSNETNALAIGGNSPEYQAALHSYFKLADGLDLYTGLRYVDALPNQGISSYLALDVNLDWQVTRRLKASLTGRNLGDPEHPEFGDGREVERSVLLRLSWAF